MDNTITGFAHLDKIADEIGDEAGTCDADYAFQKAAALMIYNLRTALEAAEAESARLRAERDWLASALAEDGCPYLAFWADLEEDMRPDWCICTDTADDGFDCTGDPKECWQQEAARRAVADAESAEKVPCPACKGKGGLEYEPGLLSYTCEQCNGAGVVEQAPCRS